jgi:hypothetical protein
MHMLLELTNSSPVKRHALHCNVGGGGLFGGNGGDAGGNCGGGGRDGGKGGKRHESYPMPFFPRPFCLQDIAAVLYINQSYGSHKASLVVVHFEPQHHVHAWFL